MLQKSAGVLGRAMPRSLAGIRSAALVAALLLSTAASAQLFQQPQPQAPRAAPRQAAPGAPVATAPRPGPPAGTAAPRSGAACHNGMSFDKFLADLKQRAVSEGVSQR